MVLNRIPLPVPFSPSPLPQGDRAAEGGGRKRKPPPCPRTFSSHFPRGKEKIGRENKIQAPSLYINTQTPHHHPRTAESSRRLSGVFPPGPGLGFFRSGRRFPARALSFPSLAAVSLVPVCCSFLVLVPVPRSEPVAGVPLFVLRVSCVAARIRERNRRSNPRPGSNAVVVGAASPAITAGVLFHPRRAAFCDAMLRSRSRRAVGGGAKQGEGGGGLMAEPPAATATATAAPVFPSPRPFMAMALPQAGLGDGSSEGPSSAMSPTSILETKQFCCSALPPFLSERSLRRARHADAAAEATEPAGVGLADVLRDNEGAKPGGGKVVFGSQLRIQVPSGRAVELVSSPIEFGAKNRGAQLAVLSPARRFLPEVVSSPSARVFTGAMAPGEMAMSEDYTCVISRGPNPRTRHIFDDCIVESCGDVLVEKMDKGAGGAAVASGFLSSCHACNKQLGHGNDIFIYRGDKAFCSSECRYQEMLFDEAVDNLR